MEIPTNMVLLDLKAQSDFVVGTGMIRRVSVFLFVILFAGAGHGVLQAGGPMQSSDAQSSARVPQQGPPGTFRVRVIMIPVDVTVTDSHDRPVTDLQRQDFQIFENGQPQDILHFSVQTYTASQPEAPHASEIRIQPAIDATPQTARTFLILLGRGYHQRAAKGVDALIRFVQGELLPQDRVAVFAYGRATDFTTGREPIVQVLEEYKKVSEKIESWFEQNRRGFNAVYGAKEIPKALKPDIARIFAAATTLGSREVPQGRINEEGKLVSDWGSATQLVLGNTLRAAESHIPMGEAGIVEEWLTEAITLRLPFDEFVPRAADTIEDMHNLFTCIEYLRYMEGEKHLLFFSEGGLLFPYGNSDYDKGIAAVANDGRVVIDTFQTGGVSPTIMPTKTFVPASAGPPPPPASPFSWGDSARLQNLRAMAELTGGRSSFGDVGKALGLVNNTTRVQYLLGYYPANDRWDNNYRQISVKVKRPGLKVFSRRGYYARDKLVPYDRAEFLAFSRISAAAGYPDNVVDVPFELNTSRNRNEAGQSQLKVDLNIDVSKVTFDDAAGVRTGRLRVTVFYADASKRPVGDTSRDVTLNLGDETYRHYEKSGIPCTILIPTELRRMYLIIVVYDTKGDRIGSRKVVVG